MLSEELPMQPLADEAATEADELYTRLSLTIDRGQEPVRIDKFLTARIENATRNKIQQALRAGMITVNGKQVSPNHKIKPGDEVVVFSEEHPDSTDIIPEPMPLDIVYEDDAVLVINKPAS
ncbi:MAG TPA: S4 domain-containing protein, partial [Phnomibacter sp.]|nr:S4 domain-containing protein [Phnomibacter sp.]